MPITLEHVSYTHPGGTTHALKDVSIQIEDGEFLGIMGETGCGKSTLLSLLAGLLTPDSGQILLHGQNIHARCYDRSCLRRTVGMVMQYPEYQLFERTVERDVAFSLRHQRLTKGEKEARIREALHLCGFVYEDIRDLSPLSLSGGEKRRIAIAGVLAADPSILLFDEPIAGLDPKAREEFLTLCDTLHQSGKTICMISHQADALQEHATRLLLLENGRILADGSPADIAHQYPACESQRQRITRMLRERNVLLPEPPSDREAWADAIAMAITKGGQR